MNFVSGIATFLQQKNGQGACMSTKSTFLDRPLHSSQLQVIIIMTLLGRHDSASLCRVERENKMAATYNVLALKR